MTSPARQVRHFPADRTAARLTSSTSETPSSKLSASHPQKRIKVDFTFSLTVGTFPAALNQRMAADHRVAEQQRA